MPRQRTPEEQVVRLGRSAPQPIARDLDWSDVVADGQRSAEEQEWCPWRNAEAPTEVIGSTRFCQFCGEVLPSQVSAVTA